MDLNRIALFLAVYRARSFSVAARERGLAPSSAARAVAALEEELGVRLFQRTTRRVAPTEAGTRFARRVAPLVEDVIAVAEDAGETERRPSGRVRATASVALGQIALAPRLPAFFARYPDVSLELILSDRPLDLLADGLDIAVRHGPLPDSGFIARRIASAHYRLVAAPAYLKTLPRLATPDDLARARLLNFAFPAFAQWRFQRGRARRVLDIAPVLAATNASALLAATRAGLGVALLADWTVAADLASGALLPLLSDWRVSGENAEAPISLVFPSRAYVPARVTAFADFVEGAIRAATASDHRAHAK